MRFFRQSLTSFLALALPLALAAAPAEQLAKLDKPAQPHARKHKFEFYKDIAPILDKRNCSAAACHGSFSGKAGLNVSLMTLNPEQDYEPLVLADKGRRVNFIQPSSSLLLLKASNQIPHEGGQRLAVGSTDYKMLHDWIAAGAPYRGDKEATVEKVWIEPKQFVLGKNGDTLQLKVTARYTDGSVLDISGRAQYISRDDALVDVDGKGLATRKRWGGSSIIVRYLGKVVCSFVTMPREGDGKPYPKLEPGNVVDEYVFKKLEKLNIVPSGTTTDAQFVRRVYLDAIGVLPAPDEVEEFVADTSPDKRATLIDELLERPEYVDYQSLRLADTLRIRERPLGQGVYGQRAATLWHDWVKDQVAANVPYDEFVRMLLTSKGSTYQNPPTNFFRIERRPEGRAETVAQAFLGKRINCARCHKHPFDIWNTDDYWNFAAMTAKVGTAGGKLYQEQVIYYNPQGGVTNQSVVGHNRGKRAQPKFLGGEMVTLQPGDDLTEILADWVVSPDNPFFAKAAINRLWAHIFGKGIVNPADDMRGTTPPSVDGLLEALSEEFIDSGYDIKYITKLILNSKAYQLSSGTNSTNNLDDRFFSHYYPHPMMAKVLLDAINDVANSPDRFGRYPMGTTAKQMPLQVGNYFLDVFGRSKREFLADLEPRLEPNLAQVLHLINSSYFNNKISSANGTVAMLMKSGATDRETINQLYLSTLSRKPSPKEYAKASAYVKSAPSRKEALEDLLWALLTSREFYFVS